MKYTTKFAAAALLLWAMPGLAAYDAFLKIDALKPASSDPSHPGWLTVSGFRWGANAPAGAPGCVTNEIQFNVPSDISYFFQHSMGHHEMIPEATIEYMNTRHLVTNLIVRDVRGTTVLLHFAECRTHKPSPVGVVPNTTTRPQPSAVVSAGLVVPNRTPALANSQMFLDSVPGVRFNMLSLHLGGPGAATLKLTNGSASFFQQAMRTRAKTAKLVIRKEMLTFTFTNCVISSYSPGTDGVDTVGLTFSMYNGPPGYPE